MGIVLHWHVVSSHINSALEQFPDRTPGGAVPGLLFVLATDAGANASTEVAAGFGNVFLKFDANEDLTQRLTATFERSVANKPHASVLAAYVHKAHLTIARSRGGHVYLLRNGHLQHLTDSAFRDTVLVDIGQIDVEAGDRILMCNNALLESLNLDQIRGVLRGAPNAKKAVQSMAGKAGDNASVSMAVIDYWVDQRDTPQHAAGADMESMNEGNGGGGKRLIPALATLSALVLIGVIAIPWLSSSRLISVAAMPAATATAPLQRNAVAPATRTPVALPPTATARITQPTRAATATREPSPTAPPRVTATSGPTLIPTETPFPPATETPLATPTELPTVTPTRRPAATRRPIRRAKVTPRPAPTRVAPTAVPPTAAPPTLAPTAPAPQPQPPQPQPPQPQPQPQPPQPPTSQPEPCLPGATCP